MLAILVRLDEIEDYHTFFFPMHYFHSTMLGVLALLVTAFTAFFTSGVETASCPSLTVALNVTTAVDVQYLTDLMDCTGQGVFDITWYSSLQIAHTIEVSNQKTVTVTGSGFPVIHAGPKDNSDNIDHGGTPGIFSVSNGSTLYLNYLVFEEGRSDDWGVVDVRASSSLFVFDCVFANNNASAGGETKVQTIP